MAYGLALSGGSLRGAVHIGIMEVLQNAGLPPQLLAGTSAGSIVGSLYASGIKLQEMEKLFYQLQSTIPIYKKNKIKPLPMDSITTQKIFWLPLPQGLINANFIEIFLIKLIGRVTFEELSMPFAVTATDLHTGELIVFTAENLIPPKPWPKNMVFIPKVQVAAAVRASSSIPGIFTPKIINHRTLLDGGLVDNVPADILRFLGARKIIAVDLGFGVQEAEPLTNLLEILLQTYDIMGQRISELTVEQHASLVIRPKTGRAGLLDFHKIPGFVEYGRVIALENLDAIRKTLDS